MKKKLLSLIMAGVMFTAVFAPVTSAYGTEKAQLDGSVVSGVSQKELDQDSVMGSGTEDQQNIGFLDRVMSIFSLPSSKKWAKKSEGVYYDGTGDNILKGAVAKGIDVSYHQGTIDWAAVAKSDIDYVIIRLGYGSDYTSQDDKKLKQNIEGCEKYNIPYGFYLYSYCNSNAKNTSEIAHTLRLLKGTNPTYPVYYDVEDSPTTGKCQNANIQKWTLNFCKAIEEAGYIPGVYASKSWFETKLNTKELDGYNRWVAQWNKTGCTYARSWNMWQCADDYKMDGISGRIDLDFAYKKFGTSNNTDKEDVTSATDSTQTEVTTKPSVTESTSTEPEITVPTTQPKKTGFVTSNGSKYYYNSDGILQKSKWITVSGKKYYATSTGALYKSTYKKISDYYYGFDSNGVMYASKTAKINGKNYYFYKDGRAYLCKVKTTARLNYRKGPSTSSKRVGTYSKGKTLAIVQKSGNWYKTTSNYWVYKKYVKTTKKYPY